MALGKFRTPHVREREKKRFLRVCVFSSIFFLAVLCSLVYAVHRPEWRIQKIVVSSVGGLSQTVVQAVVREEMRGAYFWVLPKDVIFVLPKETIRKNIYDTFPQVREVSLVREGTTLQVSFSERQAEALWCGDVVPTGEHENEYVEEGVSGCYAVDGQGFIFSEANDLGESVGALPRFYGSLPQAQPVGQAFVPPEYFAHLHLLYEVLRPRDVRGVLVVDERDLEVWLGKDTHLLLERTTPPEQVERYLSALSKKEFLTASSTTRIDMRFGNKVYLGGE